LLVASLDENAKRQLEALGDFIRGQRQMAELSLRELAARTNVSNPYLSQIERGLHEPSVRVLKAIAGALNMSAETLLKQAGLLEGDEEDDASVSLSTEAAINADQALKADQKSALLALYRSFLDSNDGEQRTKKPRA
jgi:transcriptional regulator with XRE-family HTH domain